MLLSNYEMSALLPSDEYTSSCDHEVLWRIGYWVKGSIVRLLVIPLESGYNHYNHIAGNDKNVNYTYCLQVPPDNHG